MPKYTNPIYDRTALDITNRTAKAFLNIADWSRVYDNTAVLNILLSFLQSTEIAFTEIPVPILTTFPSVTHLNQLITNIEAIRLASGLPEIPGIVYLRATWTHVITPDYEDVNDWERDIALLFAAIVRAVKYVPYCGVATTGQSHFYQWRWRTPDWIEPSATPVRRARTSIAVCGAGLTRNNLFRRY